MTCVGGSELLGVCSHALLQQVERKHYVLRQRGLGVTHVLELALPIRPLLRWPPLSNGGSLAVGRVRVQISRFRVQGVEIRLKVQGSERRVRGLGFRVSGSRFGIMSIVGREGFRFGVSGLRVELRYLQARRDALPARAPPWRTPPLPPDGAGELCQRLERGAKGRQLETRSKFRVEVVMQVGRWTAG